MMEHRYVISCFHRYIIFSVRAVSFKGFAVGENKNALLRFRNDLMIFIQRKDRNKKGTDNEHNRKCFDVPECGVNIFCFGEHG